MQVPAHRHHDHLRREAEPGKAGPQRSYLTSATTHRPTMPEPVIHPCNSAHRSVQRTGRSDGAGGSVVTTPGKVWMEGKDYVMAHGDVVDFHFTCRAHVSAARDVVVPSRSRRARRVREFRAVHGRAGMAILRARTRGEDLCRRRSGCCSWGGADGWHRSTRLRWLRSSALSGPSDPVRQRLVGIHNYGP